MTTKIVPATSRSADFALGDRVYLDATVVTINDENAMVITSAHALKPQLPGIMAFLVPLDQLSLTPSSSTEHDQVGVDAPWGICRVDQGLIGMLAFLWEKGYTTSFSCQGNDPQREISIEDDINAHIGVPAYIVFNGLMAANDAAIALGLDDDGKVENFTDNAHIGLDRMMEARTWVELDFDYRWGPRSVLRMPRNDERVRQALGLDPDVVREGAQLPAGDTNDDQSMESTG